MTARRNRLALVALVLAAFNLRWPLTSIPTVLDDIRSATGFGDVAMGALTTLPILCMGALAFLVPGLAARFGAARSVWFGLALLVVAPIMRIGADAPWLLYPSVVVAGTGIAIVGGLVPRIVKEQLPGQMGLVTGLWTAVMSGGASLGAALTVPLGHLLGSWQLGLAAWVVPAALAFAVWWWAERPHRGEAVRAPRVRIGDLPWRDPIAWALTIFIAVNSFGFYSGVAWLADSFVAHGMTQEQSALLLGLLPGSGMVAALVFPPWLQRTRRPLPLLVASVLLTMAALLGLAFVPMTASALWVIGFGGFNTGWFAMGLTMIGWLTADGDGAARLTAMTNTGMYAFAALGPVACGWLLHATGSWLLLYSILGVMCLGPLLMAPRLVPHLHR